MNPRFGRSHPSLSPGRWSCISTCFIRSLRHKSYKLTNTMLWGNVTISLLLFPLPQTFITDVKELWRFFSQCLICHFWPEEGTFRHLNFTLWFAQGMDATAGRQKMDEGSADFSYRVSRWPRFSKKGEGNELTFPKLSVLPDVMLAEEVWLVKSFWLWCHVCESCGLEGALRIKL